MLNTLSGIVTLVRLLQSRNAESPMLVTLFGIVTLVRLLHPESAESSMLITPFGILYLFSVFPSGYLCSTVLSLLNKTPSSEVYVVLPSATWIAVKLLQQKNASSPMLVTLSGIVTFVRLWQ